MIIVVVIICFTTAVLAFLIFTSFGEDGGSIAQLGLSAHTAYRSVGNALPGAQEVTGADTNTARGAAAAGKSPSALDEADLRSPPYVEGLEELLSLLRVYTAAHRIPVNESDLSNLTAAGLQLTGAKFLRHLSDPPGNNNSHLNVAWVLDDPALLLRGQEDYVERFVTPVDADVQPSPLRILQAYYDPQATQGLHAMAAAVEESMNDDGYVKHPRRSATFMDPAHAARRGYGLEGSIFVLVPFTLSDVTHDMVESVMQRAVEAAKAAGDMTKATTITPPTGAGATPLEYNPLDGTDDAASADDVDGFREVHRTAARCAATVESVFRKAHHSVAITVGTIDLTLITGFADVKELELVTPNDVARPLTLKERVKLPTRPRRRYDTITCEPPNFRSGWDDASYGYSWGDNLRRRRVVVPLTDADLAGRTVSLAHALTRRANMGRYALMELYRGESYVFMLRPGSLVLPNWDLTVRLLYLRTPLRERAVLSSRPTPTVIWHAMAAAVLTRWEANPSLTLSTLSSSTAAPPANTDLDATLDWTEKQLLRLMPDAMRRWVAEARHDAPLVLWLVTPRWLWPVVEEASRTWQALAQQTTVSTQAEVPKVEGEQLRAAQMQGAAVEAAAAGTLEDEYTLTPSFADLFSAEVLKDVFNKAAPRHGADTKVQRAISIIPIAGNASGGTETVSKVMVRGSLHTTSTTIAEAGQPVLLGSLTEADLYKLFFTKPKRAPLPQEPITDMKQLVAHQKASDAPSTLSQVPCGMPGSPLAYFDPASGALVKRAFEYCWLQHYRAQLRATAERVMDATVGSVVLHTGKAAAAADGGLMIDPTSAAAKTTAGTPLKTILPCAASLASTSPATAWHGMQLQKLPPSQCLTDMRYMDPREPPLLGSDGAIAVAASRGTTEANARYFVDPIHAGAFRGESRPAPKEAAKDLSSTPPSSTPYVLQAAASADFLFAPAEAFFDVLPEDRLQTRPATLEEQQWAVQNHTASEEARMRYERVPQSVPLDPALSIITEQMEDRYLTLALWSRGWNIFGLTEAVCAGDGAPLLRVPATLSEETVAALANRMCSPEDVVMSSTPLPEAVEVAQRTAEEAFERLVTAHEQNGKPLGTVFALEDDGTLSGVQPAPLHRRLQDYYRFAGEAG